MKGTKSKHNVSNNFSWQGGKASLSHAWEMAHYSEVGGSYNIRHFFSICGTPH